MKTETPTLEQKINSILSPVRVLSVEEWFQISELLRPETIISKAEWLDARTLAFISCFESLTRGKWVEIKEMKDKPKDVEELYLRENLDKSQIESVYSSGKFWQPALLTKEHFVSQVEEPALYQNWIADGSPDAVGKIVPLFNKYQAQQAKIWFEGFEELNRGRIKHQGLDIDFAKVKVVSFTITGTFIYKISLINPTVFDLIYQIDLYNRIAEKKILINWSENFIKELLK